MMNGQGRNCNSFSERHSQNNAPVVRPNLVEQYEQRISELAIRVVFPDAGINDVPEAPPATPATTLSASEVVRNAMAALVLGGGILQSEELVILEEQFENVPTRLSEEAILRNLERGRYQYTAVGSPVEDECCCICQDEFVDGEDLGKLDCVHEFHFNCIKQWLMEKNSCPICRMMSMVL